MSSSDCTHLTPSPVPQVLQDRGETGSRHGRAAFSVLLLQDLAVVVLLMLIPLLAPSGDSSTGGGEARPHAVLVLLTALRLCVSPHSSSLSCILTLSPSVESLFRYADID